jgi:hypothetical protein
VVHDAHQVCFTESHSEFDATRSSGWIDCDAHDAGRPFCDGLCVRRLPLLQENKSETEEQRPAWHWIGFGAAAIFIVWLPLAYLAEAVSRRLVVGRIGAGERVLEDLSVAERRAALVMLVAPQAIALLLASLSGGLLVTRFGKGTRVRDAALAGLMVGLLALGLTYAQTGPSLAALVVPLIASTSAAIGGMLGMSRQRSST